MDVDSLSPVSRELLLQALPAGQVVNVLYEGGARVDVGFDRDRRCFALGERGWLDFLGWDGEPAGGSVCASRWALTGQAVELLARAQTRAP